MRAKLVVVAVDESPAGDAAVATALDIAPALGSRIRFVHVSSQLADRLYATDLEDGPSEQELVEGDHVLGRALQRARDAGVEADVELFGGDRDTGDVAAVIAGVADGLDAGLIVCGSRGRGAAVGAVLGSVSHDLIRYARVPVLIVQAPH